MKKVLAALDNSLAGRSVIATARASRRFSRQRSRRSTCTDGGRTARTTADAAGVPLRTLAGPVVERLVEAAASTTSPRS